MAQAHIAPIKWFLAQSALGISEMNIYDDPNGERMQFKIFFNHSEEIIYLLESILRIWNE